MPGLPVPGTQGAGLPAKAEGLACAEDGQAGGDPATPAADSDTETPEELTGRAGAGAACRGPGRRKLVSAEAASRGPERLGRHLAAAQGNGVPAQGGQPPATPRWADFLKARTFRFLNWFSGANEVGVGECLQEEAESRGMTVEFEDVELRKGVGLSDQGVAGTYFKDVGADKWGRGPFRLP